MARFESLIRPELNPCGFLPPGRRRSLSIAHLLDDLQAVGKDAAGRWQYIYHRDHVRAQERKKFDRLIHFGGSIPAMRHTVAKHLRQSGLPRERVMACILARSWPSVSCGLEVKSTPMNTEAMELPLFAPGTLTVKGAHLVFDFSGKSGVQQHHELAKSASCQRGQRLLKRPGPRVFTYDGDDGKIVKVTPRHINAYIKEVMGDRFTAKDFRTWAGI